MTSDSGKRYVTAVILMAIAGFGFVIHASYPGYLDGDSLVQLKEARSGNYGDWHSPSVVVVWSVLMKIMPGPVGFLVFDNVLIWGAVATLAIFLRKRLGVWSFLFLSIPLWPGTVNYLGNVNVDPMLAAWLVAGSSLAYLSQHETLPLPARRVLQIFANLSIFAAFLTRMNAVFCLIPLLLYANARLGARRNLLLCLALLIAMPIFYKAQNTVLDVPESHPGDTIKTYHLLALSYAEGRNLFPGKWTEDQSRRIVESCYSPVQWDTASSWGTCAFIARELNWQHLWGSSQLTHAWLGEVLSHPLGLFCMLTQTFKKSLYDPNSRTMLSRPENPWNWVVEDNPPRATTDIVERYIRSDINDRLGRPWVSGLLSVLGITLLFILRLQYRNEGRFALAVLASGLIYLLTFFIFNVSAENRYFYWCGFAAYIGSLVVVLSASSLGRGEADTESPIGIDATVKLSALTLAALAAALISFPFKPPLEDRTVVITPLDSKPISVVGIHNIATPKWMGQTFEGDVDLLTWWQDGGAIRATTTGGPLVARLKTLHESIEVELATGPGMGTVSIDSPGFRRVVETASDNPGKISVELPPPRTKNGMSRGFILRNVGIAMLFFVLFFVLFRKYS